MNLLLPPGSGRMTLLDAAEQLPAPFEGVVIDVERKRMGFRLWK